MIRLAILALILAGCGGSGGGQGHPQVSPKPPPQPFADIAGQLRATVTFSTGMPYGATNPGTLFYVTIAPTGAVTVTYQTLELVATYQLVRLVDGSFATVPRSIINGETEFGTAPADLSSFHLKALKLWAGFTDQGDLMGSMDLSLVPMAPG